VDLRIQFDWHGGARKLPRSGKVLIYTYRNNSGKKYRVGYLYFTVGPTQITVTTLDVSSGYRGKGFGRLLLMILIAFAEQVKKPIFLYSTHDGELFYEKMGMRRLYYHDRWNDVTVEFMNLNPKKKFCEQCSDLDFIWVPSGIRHIRIYL